MQAHIDKFMHVPETFSNIQRNKRTTCWQLVFATSRQQANKINFEILVCGISFYDNKKPFEPNKWTISSNKIFEKSSRYHIFYLIIPIIYLKFHEFKQSAEFLLFKLHFWSCVFLFQMLYYHLRRTSRKLKFSKTFYSPTSAMAQCMKFLNDITGEPLQGE